MCHLQWDAEKYCERAGSWIVFRCSSSICLEWCQTLTCLLTPSSRVLENCFSASLEILRILWNSKFHTTFNSTRHLYLSWASSIQSIRPHPTSWRSILLLSSNLCLGLPSCLSEALAYIYIERLWLGLENGTLKIWILCFIGLCGALDFMSYFRPLNIGMVSRFLETLYTPGLHTNTRTEFHENPSCSRLLWLRAERLTERFSKSASQGSEHVK
jgi:hypothetical protein